MNPKRPPTHVGDRGEVIRPRTPGRGVPTETLPPISRDVDFEGTTPPAMDPWTYRAIKKLRSDMLAADEQHSERIGDVEDKLGEVVVSHARMEGAFSTMTTVINDERDEKKKRAEHWRKVSLKIVGGLFSATTLAAVIAAVRSCL